MDDLPRPAPPSNVPEYTVSEISGAVKRTLEGAFGRIRVRGEITELKRYPSGHIYLSLKDEGAKIAAVVWKSAAFRLRMEPENGVEVIVTGRISAHAERSAYQLIVDRMEYAGTGALLARIEMLRQRLSAEGLFEGARKCRLPVLPRVVGVITSERGAVIQDIRTTIARRFPRTILLWPVPVQGEGAAARIAAAIRGFDRLSGDGRVPRPDVLIVARGGGSLEDLMPFNDEAVIRAAASCRIPLISAVGHETDTTLIDFVADCRAPTPTAAAEMAIPARIDLLADLHQRSARLIGALNRLAQERRLRLGRAERGLPDLPGFIGGARQRLDDRAERLALALPNLLAARRAALSRAERAIPDLPGMLAAAHQRLADRALRLVFALPNLLAMRRSEMERLGRLPASERVIGGREAALRLTAAHLTSGLRHALSDTRRRSGRTLARFTGAPLRGALREARARLDGAAARLESVSPEAVLKRGYALVFDPAGHPVTLAAGVRPGGALRLRFSDGEARVVAENGKSSRQGRLPL
jgi:exodeoxyribonuclease VII large subunit